MINKPDMQLFASYIRQASANAGVTREDMARNCPNREAAAALWDAAYTKVLAASKTSYSYDIKEVAECAICDAFVASLKA